MRATQKKMMSGPVIIEKTKMQYLQKNYETSS